MILFPAIAFAAFLQALAVSAWLTPKARAAGPRLGLVDRPDAGRKQHAAPTPHSGGLALFAAFWGCVAFNIVVAAVVVPLLGFLPQPVRDLAGNIPQRLPQLAAILLGGLLLFLTGVLDDRQGLRPGVRLAIQILAALPLLATGVVLKVFLPEPLAWALTVFWVVLLVNSFNFLDNMNGLASGVCVVVCGVLALISGISREWYLLAGFALLAGAALGFWLYNFPRASIFLGDSGSTQIGYLLAVLTILATYYEEGAPSRLPILMPVIVLGAPLFDTLSVLWIRWRSGKPLMQGDRNHLSHRLVDLGMTPRDAVLFIYGATLCVGLAAVALRHLDWRYGLIQAAAIALMFVGLHRLERTSRASRRATPPAGAHPPP